MLYLWKSAKRQQRRYACLQFEQDVPAEEISKPYDDRRKQEFFICAHIVTVSLGRILYKYIRLARCSYVYVIGGLSTRCIATIHFQPRV